MTCKILTCILHKPLSPRALYGHELSAYSQRTLGDIGLLNTRKLPAGPLAQSLPPSESDKGPFIYEIESFLLNDIYLSFFEALKDKSGVDKIIVKKQRCQLLNINREFFPSFDASNFHELDDQCT